MNYTDFLEWFEKNIPAGVDEDDFLELLAMMGATMLAQASTNTGKTIEQLTASFYGKQEIHTQ